METAIWKQNQWTFPPKAWVAVGLGNGSVEVWDYVQSQKRLLWKAHTGPGAFRESHFFLVWSTEPNFLQFAPSATTHHNPCWPQGEMMEGWKCGLQMSWKLPGLSSGILKNMTCCWIWLWPTSSLAGHTDYVRCLLFSTLHPWLFSASDDCSICVWNWQSRSEMTNVKNKKITASIELFEFPLDFTTFFPPAQEFTFHDPRPHPLGD